MFRTWTYYQRQYTHFPSFEQAHDYGKPICQSLQFRSHVPYLFLLPLGQRSAELSCYLPSMKFLRELHASLQVFKWEEVRAIYRLFRYSEDITICKLHRRTFRSYSEELHPLLICGPWIGSTFKGIQSGLYRMSHCTCRGCKGSHSIRSRLDNNICTQLFQFTPYSIRRLFLLYLPKIQFYFGNCLGERQLKLQDTRLCRASKLVRHLACTLGFRQTGFLKIELSEKFPILSEEQPLSPLKNWSFQRSSHLFLQSLWYYKTVENVFAVLQRFQNSQVTVSFLNFYTPAQYARQK